MVISLLLESMTTAASVGMGCGTCCGSGISAALYGYLTTHTKDVKQSVRAFFDFFLGKFSAVIFLCCTASVIGKSVIDDSGRIFGLKAALIVDTVMLAMGIYFLTDWIREKYGKHSCKNCKGCITQFKNRKSIFGIWFEICKPKSVGARAVAFFSNLFCLLRE